MKENIQDNFETIYKVSQLAMEKIPTLDDVNDYWFVRAQGGTFYQSFLVGNFIAIGWNEITMKDLEDLSDDDIKTKIIKHNPDTQKPGAAYNQMMKFMYNIKIRDLVIVPSEAPNDLLVGKVTSRPFIETEENIASATNICPFNKRIKVNWIGKIRNSDIDPELYKLVYSGHTISEANQYKKYINRGIYDAYISSNSMSITLKIQDEENISAFDYNYFLGKVLEIASVFSEGEDVILRTNVQSKGPMELLSDPVVMSNVSLILEWVFKFALIGGAGFFGNKVINAGGHGKINWKEGLSFKINSNAENSKIEAETEQIKTNTMIEKWRASFEIASDDKFVETAQKLEIKTPEQISNAVQEVFDEIEKNQ